MITRMFHAEIVQCSVSLFIAKEAPTVSSTVSPNRRRSPTRKIPPSAYYGRRTKISSNDDDEEEERNDSKFRD